MGNGRHVRKRTLDESDRELMGLPTIGSQMPVEFENGARWECLEGQCKGCGKLIEPSLLTGRVTRVVESVASIDAIGVCHPCALVTRFSYRVHKDMRISGMTEYGWAAWRARPSLIDRIRALALGCKKVARLDR